MQILRSFQGKFAFQGEDGDRNDGMPVSDADDEGLKLRFRTSHFGTFGPQGFRVQGLGSRV